MTGHQTTVKRIIFCALVLFLPLAGCITALNQKHAPKSVSKPVDAKVQQRYYDIGLQYYSKENYAEAKRAFQTVVENGPNTTLGLKAQENLKKIDTILKTLKEIESK